jgi:hypothetical protein
MTDKDKLVQLTSLIIKTCRSLDKLKFRRVVHADITITLIEIVHVALK